MKCAKSAEGFAAKFRIYHGWLCRKFIFAAENTYLLIKTIPFGNFSPLLREGSLAKLPFLTVSENSVKSTRWQRKSFSTPWLSRWAADEGRGFKEIQAYEKALVIISLYELRSFYPSRDLAKKGKRIWPFWRFPLLIRPFKSCCPSPVFFSFLLLSIGIL